ncbi:hypothetical protein A1O7_07784 [Cladophialophora yegresii CBS 114405]|uniref:Condensation domain-containing protein n=1 Tax=Cladophialophora yegresii CBS 114405 TaxID=1182544 RepID=W9VYV6_9EURO|nr:uncharacterized protein A1O7_07784 [Cladophialophora yegresii CBS 114405]EXJ57436.1 hypothetical protein A1O7_07784 [Cladophialophora yegresii CBS 114405]
MSTQPPWLEGYATDRYDWACMSARPAFCRRIGIVESLFNTDGTDFEGRADLTIHLHVEARAFLSLESLQSRIRLVWSIMRQKHILLSSRVATPFEVVSGCLQDTPSDRFYIYEPSQSVESMRHEASQHMVFVGDHYPHVDDYEFFVHTLNSSRCIDEFKALSKLYVLPVKANQDGLFRLHFMFIAGHEIVDGLTSMRWMSDFIDLLNRSEEQLLSDARQLCDTSPIERLPPAQESLYPPVSGSRARQRWSWLLTRILRHTRRPPPASFQNPLRRQTRLTTATPPEPKFSRVLDYSRKPPLNTYPLRALLSSSSTKRLSRICRSARISIGSGCFALVAIVMMLLEEQRNPSIPAHERLPFVGSFPINPRPFLQGAPTTGKEDSLMLAFSDGITLPFVPSNLDLEGRIRLLGKQAHRQLRQYQKRPRSLAQEIHLGSRSPTQLIPQLYLNTMEYLERKSKPDRRRGWAIQGAYPAGTGSLSTCGVSSVGDRGSIISSGKYDTSKLPPRGEVIADFRNLETTVRARDGEFLVGVVGDKDRLRLGVSYDGCAIDPDLADQFKTIIEGILDEPEVSASKRGDGSEDTSRKADNTNTEGPPQIRELRRLSRL